MNWNNAKHEATCVFTEQYPPAVLPEIILTGRSNVGKSSFINTMVNIKNLARVGQTPGKTRQIIFFNIDDKVRFVDLPGYGYAKVSKTEQESWKELTDLYLMANRKIALTIQLLDIRREPTEEDLMMMKWLNHSAIPYIVVAVKVDKFAKTKIQYELDRIGDKIKGVYKNEIYPFSSLKKTGVESIRSLIESIL